MITWKLYLQKPFFLLTRVAAKVNLFSLSFSFRFLEKSSKANFMLLLSTLIHISMSSVFWIKHRYETSLLQDQKWEEENRSTMSNNFHSIDISPTSVRVGGGGGGERERERVDGRIKLIKMSNMYKSKGFPSGWFLWTPHHAAWSILSATNAPLTCNFSLHRNRWIQDEGGACACFLTLSLHV